jgi:hypothetical protein
VAEQNSERKITAIMLADCAEYDWEYRERSNASGGDNVRVLDCEATADALNKQLGLLTDPRDARIAALEAELATARGFAENVNRVILRYGELSAEINASADRKKSEKYCVIGWNGGGRRVAEYFPDIYAAFACAKQIVGVG